MKTMNSLLLFFITFVSFSQTRFKASDFDFIGIEHNNLLEKTYSSLSENKNVDNNSVTQTTLDYCQNYFDKSKMDIGMKENLNKKIADYISNKKKSSSLLPDNYKRYFNTETVIYINRLNSILMNSKDEEEFKSLLVMFEKDIYKNPKLDNSALAILYSATSVAKNSLDYWVKNAEKWQKLTAIPQEKKGFWQGVWDGCVATTTADVQGAITGAAFAVGYNIIPGGGQVGYVATIVATSFASSVASTFQ